MKIPKISLSIVVKDRAENLSLCLHSAQQLVSETILINLSAEDHIADIAKAYGAKLIPFDIGRGYAHSCLR